MKMNKTNKIASSIILAAVIIAGVVFFQTSKSETPEFAKAPGSIAGTTVLMDVARNPDYAYRRFYPWNLGYGTSYSNNTDYRDSIGFSLPGTSCDVIVSYCGYAGATRSKLFLDPTTSNEKIGRNCNYMDWKCGSEKFTGVSGGIHQLTIGTWSTVINAKDYNLPTVGDMNNCIQYGYGGGINSDNENVNYYAKTHPRYYGYYNNYPMFLHYMSVSYSCS